MEAEPPKMVALDVCPLKNDLQSRFLHRVAPYLSNGILYTSDYGTIIKSIHTKAVSDSKSYLTLNLQTASLQIATEVSNLSRLIGPSIPNSVHHFVVPSIPIVRGYD